MNNDQPKIDFSQILEYQMESLCRTLLQSCREFYSDSKNVQKFERWKAERDKENGKDMASRHSKRHLHNGRCNGDCANRPPHYGYRYGR